MQRAHAQRIRCCQVACTQDHLLHLCRCDATTTAVNVVLSIEIKGRAWGAQVDRGCGLRACGGRRRLPAEEIFFSPMQAHARVNVHDMSMATCVGTGMTGHGYVGSCVGTGMRMGMRMGVLALHRSERVRLRRCK